MNTKAKGSKNERRTIKLYEALGYRCTKSGASLGTWDIVAIGTSDTCVIQVKSNEWPRTPEMEEMREFVVPPGYKKIIVRWRDRVHLPDVKEI
jgi:Holliday junction resolvase